MSFRIAVVRGGVACFILLAGGSAAAADLSYFANGDTPGAWHWIVADPANYWIAVEGNQKVSEAKKVTLEPSDAPEFPGAVKVTWDRVDLPSKKGNWGGLSIGGHTVDLSAYEHTGELVLAMKVDAKPKEDVKLKMLCNPEKDGDKCESEISILHNLRSAKLKEWFLLPIPLDCLVEAGTNFSLKKIKTPFEMGTSARMIVHIAEISIQKMAPGDEGCKPNPAPAAPADGSTK
jgi:hypothetical protein